MPLPDRFVDRLASFGLEPEAGAVVAVSGGPDSLALLLLLQATRSFHRLRLTVGHVDHGIAADSRAVAADVARVAEDLELPVRLVRLRLGPAASETMARERRYAALRRIRRETGARYILTAHQADDQVETILMRVLRGSGPAGLAGMAAVHGGVVRPLLTFSRAELTEYLADSGLPVWSDPANRDPRHLRAWLRHQLLPAFRQRLPDVDGRLLALGRQAGADRAAWDAALDAWPGVDPRAEPEGISVAVTPLAGYDSALRMALLQAAARRAGLSLGPRRAGRVLECLVAASGASAPLGGGWWAERDFDRLRLVRRPEAIELAGTLSPGESWSGAGWRLDCRREAAPPVQPRDGSVAWFAPGSYTVRNWRPGDRIRPLGGTGSRLVVRCFQDARVPRSRRNRWPLITVDDTVVWVPGVCRSDARIPAQGAESLRVDASYA